MRWKRNWHQWSGIGAAVLLAALAGACAAQRPPGPGGVIHSSTIWGTGIVPESLTAKPGETVAWSNATSWTEALILFEEGKGVSQTCAAPVGFFLTPGRTYTSGLIAPGGEVSLCIAKAGTYEYRIRQHRSGRSYQYSGRIVVQ